MVRRFVTIVAVLAAFVNVMRPSIASAAEHLSGFWMDSDGEVIIEISPCEDAMCGKVAWLRLPNGPDGKPLLDYRNPDKTLRSRPVCGLQVISGIRQQDDGTFGGGTVYVSDLGMQFKGQATQIDDNRMEVRGYVGISLFGQSEVWKRVAEPADICGRPKEPEKTNKPGSERSLPWKSESKPAASGTPAQ